MPHRNAPLTETGRLRLPRRIVDGDWPIARAAERFQVSRPTATRWARRHVEFGPAGMCDRSPRPFGADSAQDRAIRAGSSVWAGGDSPIGWARPRRRCIGFWSAASRLWHVDRATGEPIRRYEAEWPGELVHVDVTKLGNIPTAAAGACSATHQGNANRDAYRT